MENYIKNLNFEEKMTKNNRLEALQSIILMGVVVFIMLFLSLSLVSAEDTTIPTITSLPDKPAVVNVNCFDVTASLCGLGSTCNLTIYSPNQSVIVDNQAMTYETNYFDYTTPVLSRGVYSGVVTCSSLGISGFKNFQINVSEIQNQNGIVAIGVLIALVVFAFFFAILGFKFSQSEQMMPVALAFYLISILIVIYSLLMGNSYIENILYATSVSSTLGSLISGIFYSLFVVGLVFLTIFLVSTIKHLNRKHAEKSYGEGYNHDTKTYEY